MDVTAASTANGTKVQLYDCNGTAAQQWHAGANSSLVNTGSGRCLDAVGVSGQPTSLCGISSTRHPAPAGKS
jgi:chitinase